MRYWLLNIRKPNAEKVYERMKSMLGLETEITTDPSDKPEQGLHGTIDDPENPAIAELSLLERLLPMEFECTKGAMIIGNIHVPSYIVWKAAQISGTISAEKSRSPLDYYKTCYDMMLRNPRISLEKNSKYTHPLAESTGDHDSEKPRLQSSQMMYLEDYAKIESLMEFSQMKLTYTADYAGPVPAGIHTNALGPGPGADVIGNGDAPPEWNLRLDVWNAMLYYGPWADKQRSLLQDYYFPNAHRNNKPTPRLKPGDTRTATSFDVWINFETDVVFRIPTREASKDWKFMGDVLELDIDKDGFYSRPHGWIDIRAKPGSSIKTSTPFVLDERGCTSTVEIDLKKIEVATSVNFANFVQANRFKMTVEMPAPLVWNEHREWKFTGALKRPEIFLLRDHVILFQDLVKDWTSGPTVDLAHFTPITYSIDVSIPDPKIYLCINEHNIINYPNSTEDNAYIIVSGHELKFNAVMPFLYFEPDCNTIFYNAKAEQVAATLSLPSSHTWGCYMVDVDAQIASSLVFTMEGSYEYYTSVDVLRHVESANLKIEFEGAIVKLFGILIRSLFMLRNNFVGPGLHFATVDEYRERRTDPEAFLEMRKKEADAKPMADPFEIYITCNVNDGVLLLPENLYECSHYSQLEFQELQVEMRNLDIYMDLNVSISPITWTRESLPDPSARRNNFRTKNARDPKNYLYIDETNIYAHRLFGPLPETATYLCHWDFSVGRITGELKPTFLMGATNFAQTFVYNLLDEDNAVFSELDPGDLPDVTFVKANIREIDVHLMTQNSVAQLKLSKGIHVEVDSLINEKYDQRIAIQLPNVDMSCLSNQEYYHKDEYSWVEVANIALGINLTILRHTKDWQQLREAQQNFIRSQDYLTSRCAHLYTNDSNYPASSHRSHTSSRASQQEHHVGVLYAPVYSMFPLNLRDSESLASSTSTQTPRLDARRPSMSSESIGMQSLNWSISEPEEEFALAFENSSHSSESSHDRFYFAPSYSSDSQSSDDLGEGSPSEDLSTGDPSEDNRLHDQQPPPSIPYSDYLQRYAVRRASTNLGRAFFHPYIPPPQTTFLPFKPRYDEEEFSKDSDQDPDPMHVFTEDPLEDMASQQGCKGDSKNDVVTTTILEATKPVKILVTPILVKVVQELTEVINKDDWDVETMLDSCQISYVDQLTRLLTDQFVCTRFAVLLPSTRLHFIQNVMVPADLSSYRGTQSHLKPLQDQQDKMLCAADIFFDEFKMIGGVIFQDYGFDNKQQSIAESHLLLDESRVHVSVGTMGCQVHYIPGAYDPASAVLFGIPVERRTASKRHSYRSMDLDDSTTVRSDQSVPHTRSGMAPMCDEDDAMETVVIDMALKNLMCKWVGARNPNFLDIDVGSFDSIIITQSVEILVGAVYSWLVFVDDLQRILEQFQERRIYQTQVLIHDVARISNDAALIPNDPPFLAIPTSMGLRIGGTRSFRNNVGWKLLARLRQCLRFIPNTMREKLQYQLTSVSNGGDDDTMADTNVMYEGVILAFSGWRNWEISTQDLRDCRLFTTIFHQRQQPPQPCPPSHSVRSSMQGDPLSPTSAGALDLSPPNDDQFTKDLVDFFMTSTNSAKIQLHHFGFSIYGEDTDQCDNRITITGLAFAVDTIYKPTALGVPAPGNPLAPEMTPNASNTGTGTTATAINAPPAKEAAAGLTLGYLDANTKLNIKCIDIDVDPAVMAFAEHMLKVQRVFTSKLQDLSHTTKSSSFMGRTHHRTTYGPSPSPASPLADRRQTFDVNHFFSHVDVVMQALLRIQQIKLNAWAQKLAAMSSIDRIVGSVVLSNPMLSSGQPALLHSAPEKDSDTSSGKRSNSKGASLKKSASQGSSRVIMIASGTIDRMALGVFSGTTRSPANVCRPPPNPSKLLLDFIVRQAKLNASISQPAPRAGKKRPAHLHHHHHSLSDVISPRKVLSIFSCVESMHIDAPRSILHLYGFIQDWSGEQGKKYHFMFQNLLNELEEQRRLESLASSPTPASHARLAGPVPILAATSPEPLEQPLPATPPHRPIPWYDIRLQFLLVNMVVKADLLQSLRIQYSLQDVLLMVSDILPDKPMAVPQVAYELTLDKQKVELITHLASDSLSSIPTPEDNINLFHLPCITSSGTLMPPEGSLGRHTLRAHLSIDFVPITLDVSMIDSILTAHSLLGTEVNELAEVLSYSKRKRRGNPKATTSLPPQANSPPSFLYSIDVSLTGLCVSTTSPSAAVLFESKLLTAAVSNCFQQQQGQLKWMLSGKSFSLSLDQAPGSILDSQPSPQPNRVAYIVVDFEVENQALTVSNQPPLPKDRSSEAYAIRLTRVQTLMQPTALGKMADMYIHYDAELKKKRELKRDEINCLADNTKRIVASFQETTPVQQPDMHELWKDRQLALQITKFGVAVPLSDSQMLAFADDDPLLATPTSKAPGSNLASGALLVAFTSLNFTTKNTKITTALVENITLQFVKRFDQHKDDHFVADHHPRMNRMHFPSFSCKIDSAFNKAARKLMIHCNALVSGFDIDIDSAIAEYINRLAVIYVASMDRVNSLATTSSAKSSVDPTPAQDSQLFELIHLTMDGQFTYESGTVRLYPTRQQQYLTLLDPLQKRDVREGSNMATIMVPGLQAAFSYQTSLGAASRASETPHRFHGLLRILESHNTLHPSLVQFLHEVVVGLKLGVQQSSQRKESRIQKLSAQQQQEQPSTSFTDRFQSSGNVSLILQLSKTQVELTCQPLSKVMWSLGWQDSVFVLSSFSTEIERTLSCAGSLHAISSIVKHQYSPLSCLEASIDTVNFNALLTSKRGGTHDNKDDISIVIKIPAVKGALNIRHLQDLLILGNCWFSQPIMAPTVNEDDDVSPSSASSFLTSLSPNASASSQPSAQPIPFSRHTAFQLDQLDLSVDMGQAIGIVKLTPKNLLVQTHMVPDLSQGISICLDSIHLEATGRLSGQADVHRIILDGHVKSGLPGPSFLSTCQLYILLNGLEAAFTYEFQNILHLVQEPIQLRATVNLQQDRKRLHHRRSLQQLSVAIHAGRTTASISIKTVPVVIVMQRRFTELLEKKRNEASAVNPNWATLHNPKGSTVSHPLNAREQPTIAISEADFSSSPAKAASSTAKPAPSSAPSSLAHAEKSSPKSDGKRRQPESKAKLHVDGIQIIVYPSQFQDGDNVQLAIKQIHGSLHQTPSVSQDGTILRDLRLSIDRASLMKNVPGTKLMMEDKGQSIFTLPLTVLSMHSTHHDRLIHHTFAVDFKDRVQVSLNFGQISYLREFVKMFNDQMDRALVSTNASQPPQQPPRLDPTTSSAPGSPDVSKTSPAVDAAHPEQPVMATTSPDLVESPGSPDSQPTDTSDKGKTKQEKEEYFTYVADEPVNFEPQLAQMGEATPPVEWLLGIKLERLPGLVHENVTLPLDQIVHAIWDFYQKRVQDDCS
ncbi:hypothetical protein DM01DRAFT_1364417 [Hesseltinella vesiculosa]|uniref:Fragile site-associated protein C-terminal domain-containing protein n=1 Tax=Hesseltinella vesiculosa TaxID=101127 RepID=A0A1X2G6W1_9FUNG|nr:hypothetical protein DM01DRAFT_1364417 [Hesseltinella vesiculosa]